MPLTAKVGIVGQSQYTKVNDLSVTKDVVDFLAGLDFDSGTGNNQADLLFHDQRSLAGAATENLDLAGSLVDVYGQTLTFVKVKAIIIQNLSATQFLTVGGAASAQFINWVADPSDKINIPPGGVFCLAAPLAGFAVTPATGDLLKVANSAGSVCDYKIWIIGTSA